MQAALRSYAESYCRASSAGSSIDWRRQRQESVRQNLNQLSETLKLLDGVEKVSCESEWDNTASYLVEVFFTPRFAHNSQFKLELRFSRIAPVAYDRWMVEEVAIGFPRQGNDVIVGRVFQGEIPDPIQKMRISVVDAVHLNGYFVAPLSCFDFNLDAAVSNADERKITGFSFYFGDL
jgi:hypothetical protein